MIWTLSILWASAVAENTQLSTCASSTEQAAVELLTALRRGKCTDSLPTLDLHLLPAGEKRPLDGVRCPVKIVGGFERCGLSEFTNSLADWGKFREAVSSAEQFILFDKSEKSQSFTYWDNLTHLADVVRERGHASQAYSKENASTEEFLRMAEAGHGWCRYGQGLRSFAPHFAEKITGDKDSVGKLAPLLASNSSDANDVSLHLWTSSKEVTSTAHYDPGWDNAHFVITGEKYVALAPLSFDAVHALQIRPGTHPHNRQARHSLFGDHGGGSGVVDGIVIAHLPPGVGVFIPAGWLHELRAANEVPTAALGVISVIKHENSVYRSLMMPKERLLDYFFRAPHLRDRDFNPLRLAAVLVAFAPKFLRALQLDPGKVRTAWLSNYGEATRQETGMLSTPWPDPNICDRPLIHFEHGDWEAIDAAVEHFASGFRTFRRDLLPYYVLIFFDALVSKAAWGQSIAEVLARTMSLAEACDAAWTLDESAFIKHQNWWMSPISRALKRMTALFRGY